MAEPEFPLVEIAVTLIVRGGKVLVVYNPKWGTFTLPMTKRHSWTDPAVSPEPTEEDWLDAASRAAAECLGATLPAAPQEVMAQANPMTRAGGPADFHELQQSGRQGVWQGYKFMVYRVDLDVDVRLAPCLIAEWLTPDEVLDPDRRPISPTARHLVRELKLQGVL